MVALRTGLQLIIDHGSSPEGPWSFEELEAKGLPPVVRCCACDMSLALTGASITEDGTFLCSDDAAKHIERGSDA